MKGVLCASALLVALVGVAAGGKEEKPIKSDKLKVNLDYLEKTWGMKYKSHTAASSRDATAGQVTILVEFTKDVEDVKALREALDGSKSLGVRRVRGKGKEVVEKADSKLWFYLFDSDNVLVQKVHVTSIDGELSGVKGDRVRLRVQFSADKFEKGEKLEARPAESRRFVRDAKKKKGDEE
jgi:hypothetical protein